jgi:hypothetical protein
MAIGEELRPLTDRYGICTAVTAMDTPATAMGALLQPLTSRYRIGTTVTAFGGPLQNLHAGYGCPPSVSAIDLRF